MKKLIFVSLVLLSSIFTSAPVSAATVDENYGSDVYQRIYYEDGYWHGVIDVSASMVTTWNCAYTTCTSNAIYLEFTRDLIELESIEFNYVLKPYCDGYELLGLCFGTKVMASEAQTEEVFNVYEDGSIVEFIFGMSDIVSLGSYADYDYRIVTKESREIDIVEIIEFTYILTNAEIDALNLDKQKQYDDEVKDIMIDGTLNMDEKQIALEELNEEYASWPDLVYGMSMTSLCENSDYCIIFAADEELPDFLPDINEISTWYDLFINDVTNIIYTVVGIAIAIVITLTIGKDLAEKVLEGLISFVDVVASVIANLLISGFDVIFAGISYLFSIVFKLLFWWI